MKSIQGSGIGLRREFLPTLFSDALRPDWFEVAPENWLVMPPAIKPLFDRVAAEFPLAAHGLSLSIGSLEKPDKRFLKKLRDFLDFYGITLYSEHLSFSHFGGVQSYELLPLPMTEKMVDHISQKVMRVQDILKRPLILENATWYYCPKAQMKESEFINAVIKQSGAKLLLDINNLYVNSFNHHFDAAGFLGELDLSAVAYYHVAGHLEYKKDLWIDTHGMPTKEAVWDLLASAHRKAPAPVVLERDNNVPQSIDALKPEYEKIRQAMGLETPPKGAHDEE